MYDARSRQCKEKVKEEVAGRQPAVTERARVGRERRVVSRDARGISEEGAEGEAKEGGEGEW
jgi:hypothetical protein